MLVRKFGPGRIAGLLWNSDRDPAVKYALTFTTPKKSSLIYRQVVKRTKVEFVKRFIFFLRKKKFFPCDMGGARNSTVAITLAKIITTAEAVSSASAFHGRFSAHDNCLPRILASAWKGCVNLTVLPLPPQIRNEYFRRCGWPVILFL